MNALIMHGGYPEHECRGGAFPQPSERQWLPWLARSLNEAGVSCAVPNVPDSWRFHYDDWATTFERFVVSEPMVLIGHSTGAGFLLRWLSEHPTVSVAGLFLVAPYIDPFDAHHDDRFFAFTHDPELPKRVTHFHMLHSTDDMPEIVESVRQLRAMYDDITEHRFDDKGHFTTESLGSSTLPELLHIIEEVITPS